MEIRGNIRSGELVEVVGQVKAVQSSPAAELRLVVPEGLVITSGSATWSGPMAQGQSATLTVWARLSQAGIHQVSLIAQDTTPTADENIVTMAGDSRYLAVGARSGFVERELTERFVAPMRRALPSVMGLRKLETRPQAPPGPDAAVFGRTAGLSGQALNVGRALAQVDAMGVEALFADSAAQVRTLRSALAKDRASRSVQTLGEASAGRVEALAVQANACPGGTTLRPGFVEFTRRDGVKERLPNVLIYAASVPHGFGGGIETSFRTQADGSFNACFPVNNDFISFISVYQDIGPVYVHRDGGFNPKHVFPNWWDAAWDLSQSASIPINTREGQVSYALKTWHRAVTASYSIFTARRNPVRAWYFTNGDTDRYCQDSFFFPKCTKVGEGIYFHQFTATGDDNIYSPFGEFARAHEYGHAWDQVNLGDVGGGCDGDSHTFDGPNNPGCAVQEGWADFFSAITLPRVNRDGDITRSGSGPQGPEVEWAVTNYLYDLVDNATFPIARTDDDPVSVSPDYLVRVIRDGRTNYHPVSRKVFAVQEIIALIDDVTPVPAKSQFNNYVQPTSLVLRVPRPSSITVAQNRVLWLKNIFNQVESPPPPPPALIVTANAPGYITVKATYNLTGSANQPASGWRWDRSTNGGATYAVWKTGQNSDFIAYAGEYSLHWRLFARSNASGLTDFGFAQTQVCIQSQPCLQNVVASPGPAVALAAAQPTDAAGTALRPDAQGPRPVEAARAVAGHFGAGAWFSREGSGDSTAVQLYSLSGRHDGATAGARPNSFALRDGFSQRTSTALDGASVDFTEVRRSPVPSVSTLNLVSTRLRPAASYRVSYAIDPDLGARADDDRLAWIDSLGVVLVTDPDSGAMAYGWNATSSGSPTTMREYANAPEFADPATPVEAYSEQRAASRALGRAGDVRFALTLGALTPSPAGRLAVTLIAAAGRSPDEAVARLLNERRSLAVLQTPSNTVAGAPRSFGLRQSLGPATASAVSADGGQGTGTLSAREHLRMHGLTALVYAVPDGQDADVRIRIYSSAGQLVRNLVQERRGAGEYQVDWDRLNERGERMPPGVYTAVMEAGSFRATRKLVVTR